MAILNCSYRLFVIIAAAGLSAGMTWAIRPLLLRHALAKPNARSSHRIPTPQGAGIAVIAATLAAAGRCIAYRGILENPGRAIRRNSVHGIVGFADDVKSIPVLPRLLLQAAAVGAVVFTAPGDLRIVPACPIWIERGLLLLAGLWFVNLVNFMDGLDWMTVAEVVPITGAMIVLGSLGEFPLSGNHCRRGTLRRDARICAVQPSGREGLSRRCRQPADRPAARLVPVATGLSSAIRRRIAAAAVLSCGCHRDAAAPAGQARAVLGGASLAFLSARDR